MALFVGVNPSVAEQINVLTPVEINTNAHLTTPVYYAASYLPPYTPFHYYYTGYPHVQPTIAAEPSVISGGKLTIFYNLSVSSSFI